MKKTRFREEQIIGVLHEAAARRAIKECPSHHGSTETTFNCSRTKYGGCRSPMRADRRPSRTRIDN